MRSRVSNLQNCQFQNVPNDKLGDRLYWKRLSTISHTMIRGAGFHFGLGDTGVDAGHLGTTGSMVRSSHQMPYSC